jgi:transposase-like protein
MGRKRHAAEEIVSKLRQVDVLTSQGHAVADAIRAIGVTEVTYYRWRSEYGGLKGDQVKRLKELETENGRLRRAVSDLTLDKLILTEAAKENSKPRTPPCVCGSCKGRAWCLRAEGLPGSPAVSIHAT